MSTQTCGQAVKHRYQKFKMGSICWQVVGDTNAGRVNSSKRSSIQLEVAPRIRYYACFCTINFSNRFESYFGAGDASLEVI